MPTVTVINTKNDQVGELELSERVFFGPVQSHLHWEVVRNQLANRRRGTHSTKGRSEIHGSTRKVYRQKGTGGARHGSRKANIYRGGGVAHGPKPRDYSYTVPKKVRRAALRSALSCRTGGGDMLLLEKWEPAKPRTKEAAQVLESLGVSNALVVVESDVHNLDLSLRNLPNIKYIRAGGLNVFDVLKHDKLVLTVDAAKALEQRLDR